MTSTSAAPVERAALVEEYINREALHVFVGNLVSDFLATAPPLRRAAGLVDRAMHSGDDSPWTRLWSELDDPDTDPEYSRAAGLAAIVAGECFLTLAAAQQQLAAEGRRLVAAGRLQLITNGKLATSEPTLRSVT